MNCPRCQYPASPNDVFCPECGTRIIQDQSVSNQSTPYQPVPVQPKPHKSSSNIIIAVVAVVLVVAIAAGVGLFFVFGKKDKATVLPAKEATTASNSTTKSNPTSDSSDTDLTQPNVKYTEETYYVSSINGAVLKSGPSSADKTLDIIDYNCVVKIRGGYDGIENWVYVYCPEQNAYGWVNSNKISQTSPSSAVPYTPDNTYSDQRVTYYTTPTGSYITTPNGARLMLRSTPNTTENNIIIKMPSGSYVTVYGYSTNHPDWLYIKYYEDGYEYTGFASSEYIE